MTILSIWASTQAHRKSTISVTGARFISALQVLFARIVSLNEVKRKPGTACAILGAMADARRPRSILFIVLVALLLRLAVIAVGHTYRITPRRDHFQFGWEMGRLARSIATGQGFSSPTDLPSGPS